MITIDPQKWARQFATDLIVGGERVPFDRVLRTHAASIAGLRAQGLTWASLARLLERAGVRRPAGKRYSADHLRVAFQRFSRGKTCSQTRQSGRHSAAHKSAASLAKMADRNAAEASGTISPRSTNAASSRRTRAEERPTAESTDEAAEIKDITNDELDSVLNRLNRFKH